MLGCYCACIALILIYGGNCLFQNKKRERELSADGTMPELAGPTEDVTDFENKAFRYSY